MITLSVSWNSSGYKNYMLISIKNSLIAELAERSPINIQNSSNPSANKIWMYDHTTIQGATFNMHGQMYCVHTNAMALFSSPVVSALGSELDDPGSSPGWGKALCPCNVRGKKKCELHC